MINNPIIQRELVGTLRNPRALAAQVVLVAMLCALVLLRWPDDSQVNLTGAEAQGVLRVFGYGLLVGMILLSPVFPATSIVKERVRGTLALLLNSSMSRWAILFGKLVGTLGFLLLLLLLSLPAAAACVAMGGVGVGQIAQMYLVLVLCATQYAAMALLVSTYARSTDAALRITYGLVLLLAVVTLGPHQFLQGLLTGSAGVAIEWIRNVSPLPAMMEILGDTGVISQGLIGPGGAMVRYIAIALVSTGVFLIWTGIRLHQRIFDHARDQGKITDERSTGIRVFRRLMYIVDPQKRTGLIGPLANPVMVKEFRCRRFGRLPWILRLAGFCLVLSFGLMLATTSGSMDWGVNDLGGVIVLIQMALVILIAPSLASGLISTEVESRGWVLLQTTPMSVWTIVSGKLLSVVWTLFLILLATLPCYVVMIYIDPHQMHVILQALGCVLATAIFAIALSAMVSSLFSRTAASTATSYAVLVGLCAGTMLVWLSEGAPFGRGVVETVLKINPVAAALCAIQARAFADYDLVPAIYWTLGTGTLICLFVLAARTRWLTRPR